MTPTTEAALLLGFELLAYAWVLGPLCYPICHHHGRSRSQGSQPKLKVQMWLLGRGTAYARSPNVTNDNDVNYFIFIE